MKASQLKGALLEYIVRQLLKSCGFTSVRPDGIYLYEKNGLFFINGKGAAHDADVLMNPPIQIPFGYPSQLLFECKAYEKRATLERVRNVLGLRNDINDFEIVTQEFVNSRKNTRRTFPATESRTRYIYQVGLATINGFTKDAEEFATNNKIPLLALNRFMPAYQINNFERIDNAFMESMQEDDIKDVYRFFKDKNDRGYLPALLESNNPLSNLFLSVNETIKNIHVGVLETGDLIFLTCRSGEHFYKKHGWKSNLKAKIYWDSNQPDKWELRVYLYSGEEISVFDFYLPQRLFEQWQQLSLDKQEALHMKERYFSRLFLFDKTSNVQVPFTVITIDQRWLEEAQERLNNNR